METNSHTRDHHLQDFGYKQELRRDWSLLHNFGISFSIISVVTGIVTLFEYGLSTGGPAVMSIGWLTVSFFTMAVALSMAEIVSAIPTSGGPYFWAAILAPDSLSTLAAWMTGWFNLLGQVGVTTGISFGCAQLISTTATIHSNYSPSAGRTLGIYALILVSHGLINSFGVRVLRYFNVASILLHSGGVCALAIAVLVKAPTRQSASFVFATFYDGTGDPGWSVRASRAYVAICGILMSQYTITGFDASAHLSEETHNAAWNAPIGVLTSVGVSSIFGFFLLITFLFSVQDFQTTVNSPVGQPIIQILLDIFGPNGATGLAILIILCVWHAGLFSITANSRMMFGFCRDGGLPSLFRVVDNWSDSPIYAIWLAATLALLLALPSLGSSVAFSAATSIATIGLYISYAIPIFIGCCYPNHFQRGPFNLYWASRIVAVVAISWVCFLVVVLCLPEQNPVNSLTFNYTPVAVAIVALGGFGSWLWWARRSFAGPIHRLRLRQQGQGSIVPEGEKDIQ